MRRNDVFLIIAIVVIALFIYSKYEKRDYHYLPEELDTEFYDSEPEKVEKEITPEQKEKDNEEIRISRTNAITKAVEKIEPAVVSVNVIKTKIVRRRMGFFFGFYDDVPYNIKSMGSGVVFSKE
jgi:S1-C subfamily serine protease